MSIIPQKLVFEGSETEEPDYFLADVLNFPIPPPTPNPLLTHSEPSNNSLLNRSSLGPMPVGLVGARLRVEIAAERYELDLWAHLVKAAKIAVNWVDSRQVEGSEKTEEDGYGDDVTLFTAFCQSHSQMSQSLDPEVAAEKVPWDDLPVEFGRDIYGNEVDPYLRLCAVWKKIQRPLLPERGDLYKATVLAQVAPLHGPFGPRLQTLRTVASALYHYCRLNNFGDHPVSSHQLSAHLNIPRRTVSDALTMLVDVRKWATLVQAGESGTDGNRKANVYRWNEPVDIRFI